MSDTDEEFATLSDESSFYGDDETKSEFEQRDIEDANDVDALNTYWKNIHPHLPSTIVYKNQKSSEAPDKSKTNKTNREPEVQRESQQRPEKKAGQKSEQKVEREVQQNQANHPHDNNPVCCWQSNETITDFLKRLPPSTTRESAVGPWIYVRNPHVYCFMDGVSDDSGYRREDVAALLRKGQDLFHSFENQRAEIEAANHSATGRTRSGHKAPIDDLRRELETNIFEAARDTRITTGKWMLFPYEKDVDEVWAAVAGATIKGKLGVGAKVATNNGSDKVRMVAIYTHDHEDREDVRRVLEKLFEMGLVDKKASRPIYYKCDAYTYLNLDSKNSYGLKTSRYSSKDILAR